MRFQQLVTTVYVYDLLQSEARREEERKKKKWCREWNRLRKEKTNKRKGEATWYREGEKFENAENDSEEENKDRKRKRGERKK